jgi:hypothetical protein
MKRMGPNEKKLVIRRISMLMIQDGGDFSDGLRALCDNPSQYVKPATEWVSEALEAVKAAPDNPYGDDNEVIAAAILEKMK